MQNNQYPEYEVQAKIVAVVCRTHHINLGSKVIETKVTSFSDQNIFQVQPLTLSIEAGNQPNRTDPYNKPNGSTTTGRPNHPTCDQ
jgi:hypothetical protein